MVGAWDDRGRRPQGGRGTGASDAHAGRCVDRVGARRLEGSEGRVLGKRRQQDQDVAVARMLQVERCTQWVVLSAPVNLEHASMARSPTVDVDRMLRRPSAARRRHSVGAP